MFKFDHQDNLSLKLFLEEFFYVSLNIFNNVAVIKLKMSEVKRNKNYEKK